MNKCSVYAFKCGDYIKIGMSNDPQGRAKAIESGNPYEVVIVKTWDFQSRTMARNVEKMAHILLKESGLHHRYEWFILNDLNHVITIVNRSIDAFSSDIELKKDALRNRSLNKIRPLHSLLQKEIHIEKESKERNRKNFYENCDMRSFVLAYLPEYNLKKISSKIFVDNKSLSRFVKRGIDLTHDDLKKCFDWLFLVERRKIPESGDFQ